MKAHFMKYFRQAEKNREILQHCGLVTEVLTL